MQAPRTRPFTRSRIVMSHGAGSPVSSHVPTTSPARSTGAIRQFSAGGILGVWAAATVPMALGAWVVAPALHDGILKHQPLGVSLLVALTAGLIWQFVLAYGLVAWEQQTLSWRPILGAMWVQRPVDQSTGKRGGRLWLWAVAFALLFGLLSILPIDFAAPKARDLAHFLASDQGRATLKGAWDLFALIVALAVFNTVLGEELLFRGVLLPRMSGVFKRRDWIANAVLFGVYHVHQPWSIPSGIVSGMLFAYPTRRFRCVWMGVIEHSMQSLLIVGIVLALTLR